MYFNLNLHFTEAKCKERFTFVCTSGINALKILCSGFGELKANEEPTPCTLPNPRRSSVFFLGNSSDILIYEGWSDSSYNLFALRVTGNKAGHSLKTQFLWISLIPTDE